MSSPTSQFVNGHEFFRDDEVEFGLNWSKRGEVQGFGGYGESSYALILTEDNELIWRSHIRPAHAPAIVETKVYAVLAKSAAQYAPETDGVDIESEDYARLVEAGWLEKYRWTRTIDEKGNSNMASVDYTQAQVQI